MNEQHVEPQVKGDGTTLDFHSMFFTIQGEGPFVGRRAVFIRLAGCNLQCPLCDTEYTQGRKTVGIQQLALEVYNLALKHRAVSAFRSQPCLAVITGGEPLRQPIGRFVKNLRDHNFAVQIESNGVFAPDMELQNSLLYDPKVFLVISPKTHRVHPQAARFAHAYKYVIDHRSLDKDGLPFQALEHPGTKRVARPPDSFSGEIYVSPCDVPDDPQRNRFNLKACADSAMEHGYVCGIQLHKILELP
jgi:7-carboxy-7-deazaguanine synthase